MPVHPPREHAELSINVRYIFIALDIFLWAITMVLSGVLVGDFALLIIHAVAGIVLLVYLPAAIRLCHRRSNSRFDSAASEVSYLVIQSAVWIVSAAFALPIGDQNSCDGTPYHLSDGVTLFRKPYWCKAGPLMAVPSFIHLGILLIWMTWIIVVVHRAGGMKSSQAFKIPVPRLLRGTYGGEDTEVDLGAIGTERGMVDPFIPASGEGDGRQMLMRDVRDVRDVEAGQMGQLTQLGRTDGRMATGPTGMRRTGEGSESLLRGDEGGEMLDPGSGSDGSMGSVDDQQPPPPYEVKR